MRSFGHASALVFCALLVVSQSACAAPDDPTDEEGTSATEAALSDRRKAALVGRYEYRGGEPAASINFVELASLSLAADMTYVARTTAPGLRTDDPAAPTCGSPACAVEEIGTWSAYRDGDTMRILLTPIPAPPTRWFERKNRKYRAAFDGPNRDLVLGRGEARGAETLLFRVTSAPAAE